MTQEQFDALVLMIRAIARDEVRNPGQPAVDPDVFAEAACEMLVKPLAPAEPEPESVDTGIGVFPNPKHAVDTSGPVTITESKIPGVKIEYRETIPPHIVCVMANETIPQADMVTLAREVWKPGEECLICFKVHDPEDHRAR
jgi:hypothetical protein